MDRAEIRLDALRQDLLNACVQVAEVMLVGLDARGEVVLANRRACEVLDRGEPEILGRNWFDSFLPGDAREPARAVFRRLMDGELDGAGPHENPVLTRSGERRLVAWRNTLLRDSKGRIVATLSSGTDVTEERRMERQVRLLLRAIEQSPALALLTDAEGRIEYVNPKFTQVTGYTLDEIRGKNPNVLKSGRTPREVYRQLWIAIRAGKEWRGEFLNRRKNGEYYWGETVISPVRDAEGVTTHFLELMEDITERRRLERAVVSVSEEERRWIGQELHDVLGQQLTAITLLSKALENRLGAEGHPGEGDLSNIRELATTALSGVRDLAQGLYPVEVERSGLAAALRQLAENQNRLFHVACDFEGEEPDRPFDPFTWMNLFRIAQEAVNNAVKHAGASRIILRMRHGEETLVLEVEDDGRGLPANPPSQTGMGLRIMRYRASMIGANLEIESEPRRGTRIVCTVHWPDEEEPAQGSGDPA